MSLLMALPKGRLLDEVKELFKKIDIEFDTNSRKLIIDSSEEWLKFAVLRTWDIPKFCLLYTSPSPRDSLSSGMPSSA